jgi:hypothetical protein
VYGVIKDKNEPDRRLFLSMGNNFAKSDIGFAYRIKEVRVDRQITATAIDWEGAVEITAEEAMAKEADVRQTKTEAAIAWLRTRLVAGPVLASQIKAEVEAQGLMSWKTVERAGDEVADKQKDGFQGNSTWSLKSTAR